MKVGGEGREGRGPAPVAGVRDKGPGGGDLCLARERKETSRRGEVEVVVGERKRKTRREGKPDSYSFVI